MNRADLDVLNREQLIELVLGLAQQVAELKARLELPAKTPENSSLPPSHGHKPGGGGARVGARAVRGPRGRSIRTRPQCARSAPPAVRIAKAGSTRRRRGPASATITSRSRRSAPRSRG